MQWCLWYDKSIPKETYELGLKYGLKTCRGKATNSWHDCFHWGHSDDCERPTGNNCCGTNRGNGDGVTGCSIFQSQKCIDNNNYPCISMSNQLVGAANTD